MKHEKFSSTLHHFNLIFAVKENNWDKFITSLPFVSDVNIMHLGLPLVMQASGNLEMTKALVERGADISSMDVRYIEPLEVIDYLASRGLELNRPDTYGNTHLMMCASHRDYERAELLLRHGADPHLKNSDGMSALKLCEDDTKMADIIIATAKTVQHCDAFIEQVISPRYDGPFMVENSFSELHFKILAIKEQLMLQGTLTSKDLNTMSEDTVEYVSNTTQNTTQKVYKL